MALSLEQHTINRINNTLAMAKPMGLRQLVDATVTANNGKMPDHFFPLDALKTHYENFFTTDAPDHMTHFMATHVYQAWSWQYSRYTVVIDPRVHVEVLTTKPDPVFHGEVLRRLPEWTIRFAAAYELETSPDKPPIGVDMLVSRAWLDADNKDAAIITLTTQYGPGVNDITYRTYVLDLDKPTLLEAVQSLPEWNTDPCDGSPFDPEQLKVLERFMPCLMFVCSEFPLQPKSQGHIHHHNVKIKKKGKTWVVQATNKPMTHVAGTDIARLLYEDADYVANLEANIGINRTPDCMPEVRAEFIGEWDDLDAEDPTFHYDWIPPVFDEKNEEENPS